MKHRIILLLSLVVIWAGLTGVSVGSILNGLMVSLLVIYLTSRLAVRYRYNLYPGRLLKYSGWLFVEIVKSSWQVSRMAWSRHIFAHPSLEMVKTTIDKDIGKAMYANSITLTPGTLTLAVEKDKFLVHLLDQSFAEDLHGGDMEKRIKHTLIKC